MSEINGGFTKSITGDTNMWLWDPGMADAMVWAHNIHDYLTIANVSGWEYWELADYSGQPVRYNDGLVDGVFSPGKRYYVIGNWSKYVRSGWVRIDATASPAKKIYVTAFKEESSGNFAIVVINQNSYPVVLTFSLDGFPDVTSVNPTLTSISANLIDQEEVNVSNGGFSYQLPATSVVTFHCCE